MSALRNAPATLVRGSRRGVEVVRLGGDVGREQGEALSRELAAALRASGGEVLLDLRATRHIHYRVAAVVAELSRSAGGGRRLGLVGPTPYVRQILRLAGALEDDLREYRSVREAVGARAA